MPTTKKLTSAEIAELCRPLDNFHDKLFCEYGSPYILFLCGAIFILLVGLYFGFTRFFERRRKTTPTAVGNSGVTIRFSITELEIRRTIFFVTLRIRHYHAILILPLIYYKTARAFPHSPLLPMLTVLLGGSVVVGLLYLKAKRDQNLTRDQLRDMQWNLAPDGLEIKSIDLRVLYPWQMLGTLVKNEQYIVIRLRRSFDKFLICPKAAFNSRYETDLFIKQLGF